jgi:hypothetical protein
VLLDPGIGLLEQIAVINLLLVCRSVGARIRMVRVPLYFFSQVPIDREAAGALIASPIGLLFVIGELVAFLQSSPPLAYVLQIQGAEMREIDGNLLAKRVVFGGRMSCKFERPERRIRTQRVGIRARRDNPAKFGCGLADQIVVAQRAQRRVALKGRWAGGNKRFGVKNGFGFVEEIRRGVNGDELQMWPGEVRSLIECGGEQLDGLRRVSA